MPCSPITDRHTDTQTDTKVTTVGTLSGFQEFFLQPIIKDRPNYNQYNYLWIWHSNSFRELFLPRFGLRRRGEVSRFRWNLHSLDKRPMRQSALCGWEKSCWGVKSNLHRWHLSYTHTKKERFKLKEKEGAPCWLCQQGRQWPLTLRLPICLSVSVPLSLPACLSVDLPARKKYQRTSKNPQYSVFLPDRDECASGPCYNSGTCTDTLNGYTCQCMAHVTGDNCDVG